mmetsp:Transcript_11167/g.21965  ORF Transcript_11167/g.21965 Transcript_11167/m.21965 type:complete len:651 (+) Transcript_11167:1068-3020(+)
MQMHAVKQAEKQPEKKFSSTKPQVLSDKEVQETKRRIKLIEQLIVQTKDGQGAEQQLTRELLHNERTRLVKLIEASEASDLQDRMQTHRSKSPGSQTERRYNSLKMPQEHQLDEWGGTVNEIRGYPSSQQQLGRVNSTSRILEPKPSWNSHREGSFFSREVSEISRHDTDTFNDSDLDIGFCSDSDDMEESVISNPLPSLTPKMHEFRPSFVIHDQSGNDYSRAREPVYAKPRKEKPVAPPVNPNPLIVQVAPYPYYPPYNPMQWGPNYAYPQYPNYAQYPYPHAPHPQAPHPHAPPPYHQYPPQEYKHFPESRPAQSSKVDSATQCASEVKLSPMSCEGSRVYDLSIESSSVSVKSSLENLQGVLSPTKDARQRPTKSPNLTIVKEVSQLQITVSRPPPQKKEEPYLVCEEPVFSKEGSDDDQSTIKSDSEHSGSIVMHTKQGFENISLQTSAEYPPPKPQPKAAPIIVKSDLPAEVEDVQQERPKAWAMEIAEEEGLAKLAEALAAKKLQIMKKLQERKVAQPPAARHKSPKTKEELYELRKEMLKSHKKPKQPPPTTEEARVESEPSPVKPQSALLARLASGSKVKVTRKEMRRLTNKFTSVDPVKAERDEQERKKAELKQRVASAKAYEEKSRQERMMRLKKTEAQ